MNKEIRIEEEEKADITTKPIKPKRLSPEETEKRVAVEKRRVSRRGETSGLIPEVPKELKKKYVKLIRKTDKTSRATETWRGLNTLYIPTVDNRKSLDEEWWNTKAVMKAVGRTGIRGFFRRIFGKNK